MLLFYDEIRPPSIKNICSFPDTPTDLRFLRMFSAMRAYRWSNFSLCGRAAWGIVMKGNMEERACDLAVYIIENRATVRTAAKKFGISKSTVHKDLQDRLPQFNRTLYLQVKEILDENKAQRHIRGGLATRKKYKGI